jgi:4-diphosphocytidyl-2-C-methyl-D-erythritol kinase
MLRVRVPAKVNLHLEVLGRRDDGFHEVRTLLQSVDLYDEVAGEATDDGEIRLAVEPAGAVPEGDGNLVVAAARRLAAATGVERGAMLRLRKRIPVGAGLGGGSADAAATLVLLAELWDVRPGPAALARIAAGLGTDVPFFLTGGLALGVGRGDEVVALPDLPRMAVVVVVPPVAVPTAEVYRQLDAPARWRRPGGAVYSISGGHVDQLDWSALVNDLEPVVTRAWDEVAAALAALDRDGAERVAVTGSGSAVYGVYRTAGRAREVAAGLGSRYRVHIGTTVDRAGARLRTTREQEGHTECRSPR